MSFHSIKFYFVHIKQSSPKDMSTSDLKLVGIKLAVAWDSLTLLCSTTPSRTEIMLEVYDANWYKMIFVGFFLLYLNQFFLSLLACKSTIATSNVPVQGEQ